MNKKDINDWIMYHTIHQLLREGFSLAKVARELVINPRTVKKYSQMSEADYEGFLLQKTDRTKTLSPYEGFVKQKLLSYPQTSAAQMHDWLKEHHEDFPGVPPKTVYNFVMWVRQKNGIALESTIREYFAVEELPYGRQCQADFGQYNMRTCNDRHKKVHFFVLVLSLSRYKYVQFSDTPFTTHTTIEAHENGFRYFEGIPLEMVYDQDKLLLVDENYGELLLTRDFKQYVLERGFKLHFCRKQDPESKVESAVKYVKQNFLYNRVFYDLETLQQQALDWLSRTANFLPHHRTRKAPCEQWVIEKGHLQSWCPIGLIFGFMSYYVRKDNTICYCGNYYSLPQGTYRGRDTIVHVREAASKLEVYNDNQDLICMHQIAAGTKGQLIINNDHKRNKSLSIDKLIEQLSGSFENPSEAKDYFEQIRKNKPRYIRDQLQIIQKAIEPYCKGQITEVLQRCIRESIFEATGFKTLMQAMAVSQEQQLPLLAVKLLNAESAHKAKTQPQTSSIQTYEQLFPKK